MMNLLINFISSGDIPKKQELKKSWKYSEQKVKYV